FVEGLASTFRAIQGARTMPAAPAVSFRKSRRPVLDWAGFAMACPLVSLRVLESCSRDRRIVKAAYAVRGKQAVASCGLSSCAGDRLLHERVVGEDEGGHRLHHRDRAREHAGIVAPASHDGRVLARHAHRALLLHDGRGRLEGDAEVDRLAVGDASLHAARAIGARPHLDRKSTRLNSSHVKISYAVFCLKKKT